jgi:isopentenyl phosphate kinase
LANLTFLKLGGSVITDKTSEAVAREDVIARIAREIKRALDAHPAQGLLLGHGSGSFGHYVAKKTGYGKTGNWRAYAETGAAAARLNRLVNDLLLAEGIPVVSMQPSASAICRDGELVALAAKPIQTALSHGLVPLVYGDVAFDETRGMTITSTETLFAHLAPMLKPTRILLAGIVEGVYTADPLREPSAQLIREITPANYAQIEALLSGSHGVDVTGGMLTKVKTMLALAEREPGTTVQLLSAITAGSIDRALMQSDYSGGTVIRAAR